MKSVKLKVIAGSFTLISMLTCCVLYLHIQPDIFVKPPLSLSVATPVPSNAPGYDNQQEPVSSAKPKEDSNDELFSRMKTCHDALLEYIDKFSMFSEFVTRNGYLYSLTSSADDYVKYDNLAEAGLIQPSLLTGNVFLMYLRPSDFLEFTEINIGRAGELCLFTALETREGIAFYSEAGSGILYRENFTKLTDKYDYLHGKITRPNTDSPVYQEAMSAISLSCFDGGGIDFRYLAIDDKYAAATVSAKSDPYVIYQVLLERVDDYFEVLLFDFEKGTQISSYVNSVVPDMNLELLPIMDFAKYAAYQLSDFGHFADTLIEMGLATPDDDLTISYASGTSKFAYICYANGDKYLFTHFPTLGWAVYPCDNYRSAEKYMRTIDEKAPFFILKQE